MNEAETRAEHVDPPLRVMAAIAEDRQRILLTLATGTGKTFIAFQIAWKLFHSRWNLSREPSRRPRVLFLAEFNSEAALWYIWRRSPSSGDRTHRVPIV